MINNILSWIIGIVVIALFFWGLAGVIENRDKEERRKKFFDDFF